MTEVSCKYALAHALFFIILTSFVLLFEKFSNRTFKSHFARFFVQVHEMENYVLTAALGSGGG